MKEIVKHINDTNASYRTMGAGDAKNTDLFLDNEHFELFKDSGEQITVRFDKENLSKAILFIASILPRKYDCSATHTVINYSVDFVLEQLAILDGFFMVDGRPVNKRTQVWNARKDVEKKNGEIDPRFYFNGLISDVLYNYKGVQKLGKFTLRNYLAGAYSDIKITKAEDGIFDIIVTNALTPNNDGAQEDIYVEKPLNSPLQQIYYGAPGTGKSHEVKVKTGELDAAGKEHIRPNVFRTTFHPDTDYATFVGCYKPTKEEVEADKTSQPILDYESLVDKFKEYLSVTPINITKACTQFGHDYHDSIVRLEGRHTIPDLVSDAYKSGSTYDSQVRAGMAIFESLPHHNVPSSAITYEFVPQAFTDAYIYAYNNPTENTFLVIEEINRGNCAQIFGDLFQLLDRNGEGKSEYTIKADKDLAKYLIKQLGSDSEGIKDGKLRLPANLHILATMNTSDQSLFPMDSAFKRRWDWKYIAISYTEPKSSAFMINVGEGHKWVDFIKQVNKRIFALTQSEDKELGNFFIKDSIDAEQFKSKVMFYLWYEVLRDEVENSKYFFYYTVQDEPGKETNHKFTFKDLYGENSETILEGFLRYITKDAE